MRQLTLPGVPLDWQAVVPMDPQPHRAGRWFGFPAHPEDWVWESSPGCSSVVTHPEQSDSWPRSCPFKVGQGYGQGLDRGVIERVEVKETSEGWVWVLKLRKPTELDLEPFWQLVRRPPPEEPFDEEDWSPGGRLPIEE